MPIIISALGTVSKGLKRGLEEDKSGLSNNVEIGHNTGKSPGSLRTLSVIQTFVKDQQLRLL